MAEKDPLRAAGLAGSDASLLGRTVGKVLALCVPEAVARLIELQAAERDPDEATGDFLARSLDRPEALVAPLEFLLARVTAGELVGQCPRAMTRLRGRSMSTCAQRRTGRRAI
ncbi:MAG TPA: hypothetical protein VMK12_27450 [Anaeromyxobacteraceae bacterium]|nr:hypothetical protein [Anaeromyxobacteraceae bacterium]